MKAISYSFSDLIALRGRVGESPWHWRLVGPPLGGKDLCVRCLFQGDQSLEIYAVGEALPPVARLVALMRPELLDRLATLESSLGQIHDRLEYAAYVAERAWDRAVEEEDDLADELAVVCRAIEQAGALLGLGQTTHAEEIAQGTDAVDSADSDRTA